MVSLFLCLIISMFLLKLDNSQKESFFEVSTSTLLYPATVTADWVNHLKMLNHENDFLKKNSALLINNT